MSEAMKLYGYWRSGAAFRVRIALNLKKRAWEDVAVHLVKGEQRSAEYRRLNPIGLVPALELADGTVLTQSLAILDWLDRTEPDPPLFPADPIERAHVMAAGMTIAVDTHPLQNSGVTAYVRQTYGLDEAGGVAWMAHWMERGFSAFQAMCRQDTTYAFGDQPSFADICLVPQLYNAHRWKIDLSPFPRLLEIERNCFRLPAFHDARPEAQPDAE